MVPSCPLSNADPCAVWLASGEVGRGGCEEVLRLQRTTCREDAELQAATKRCVLGALAQPGELESPLATLRPSRQTTRIRNQPISCNTNTLKPGVTPKDTPRTGLNSLPRLAHLFQVPLIFQKSLKLTPLFGCLMV